MELTEIEINVVSPADAEAVLRIESSENEMREEFTYSEKMDYARLLEKIEEAKAKERMSFGGKGGIAEGMDECPYLDPGTSRDAIGDKIGMSGRQYDRAKYIADNAPNEVIEQLDRGERSIGATYKELRSKEKLDSATSKNETPRETTAPKRTKPVSEEKLLSRLSPKDRENVRKLQEFNAMSAEEKVVDLQRQLKEMRVRAVTAESDLASLKERYEISVDHKDSIIESLKRQNAELSDALDAANNRWAELENGFPFIALNSPKTPREVRDVNVA